MTPSEKIIAKFYAANIFMMNESSCEKSFNIEKRKVFENIQKALEDEVNINYSVKQISEKWQYLCNIFFTAEEKVCNKQTLTYMENSIYQRLFFLRSIMISNNKDDSKTKKSEPVSELLRNFNSKNIRKTGSASEEMVNQVDKLLLNKENSVRLESASILNEIILSHRDPKIQRLCLHAVLKSIKKFCTDCKQ